MVSRKRDGTNQRNENSSSKKKKKKKTVHKSRLSRIIMEEEDSKEGSDSLGDIDWEENIEVDTPCLDEFAPPTRNASTTPASKNVKATNLKAMAPVMVPVAADPTVSAAVAAIDMIGAVEQQFEEADDDYFSPEDKVLVRDVITNEWVSGCVKEVDGEGLEVLVALDIPGRDLEWVSVEKDRIKPASSNSCSVTNTSSVDQKASTESILGSISSVIAGSPSKLVPASSPSEPPPRHTTPSVAPAKKKRRRGLTFTFGHKKPAISPLAVAQPSRNRIKTPKGAGYEMSKTVNRRMPIWKTEKSPISAAAFKMIKKSKFKEGEKILAKWSDHRMQKFPAVIKRISGPGQYDVLFYDGFEKTIAEENIFKCSVEEEEKYKHSKPSEADFLIEEENLNKAERRQKKRKTFDGYLSEKDFKRKRRSSDGILNRRPMISPLATPRSRKRKLVVDTPPPPVHADPEKAKEETGTCDPLVDKEPKETTTPVKMAQEDVTPLPPEVPVVPTVPVDESLILDHYPLSITCHDGVIRKSVIAPDDSVPSGWSKHLIPWVGESYSAFLYSPDGYAINNQAEFDKYMLKSGLARKLPARKPLSSLPTVPILDPPPPVPPKDDLNKAEQVSDVNVETESPKEAKSEVPDIVQSEPPIAVKTEPLDTTEDNSFDELNVKSPDLVDSSETDASDTTGEVSSAEANSELAVIKTESADETKKIESEESSKIETSDEPSTSKPADVLNVTETSEEATCSNDNDKLLAPSNNDSAVNDLTNIKAEPQEASESPKESVHNEVIADTVKPTEATGLPSDQFPASETASASPIFSTDFPNQRSEVTYIVNFDVPPLETILRLIDEQASWPTRGRYRKWINRALDEKRKAAKKIRILPPSRSFPVKRVRTLLPKHRQQLQGMGKGIDPGKVWRCPKESCGKKFRKENLLQMHIKHYHAELSKGKKGPKVVDLAVARSVDSMYISQTSKAATYPSPRLSVHAEASVEERHISSPRRSQMEESDVQPAPTEERKQTIKTLLPRPPAKAPPPSLSTPGVSGSMSGPTVKLEPILSSPSQESEPEIHIESKTHIRDVADEGTSGTLVKPGGSLKRRPHHHHQHYVEKQPSAVASEAFMPEFHGGEPSPNTEVTEDGVVIERLKSEEIINCVCGVREEDGLMVQCEICLCWQHGACTGIEHDSDVPDRYVCRTCRNPLRVRSTHKYHYARQFLTQAKLPRFSLRTCKEDVLKQREGWLARSFELSSSLRQLQRIETSLSTKINIAQETDHPKLYLWSTSWDENKSDQGADSSDKKTENGNGRETTPGGSGPVGEAPIESEDCRLRLLDHIEHYQQQMDARLSHLQAHIASLESEDADLANEESCSDHHPLVKQAVYMMLRDLTTLRTAITLS